MNVLGNHLDQRYAGGNPHRGEEESRSYRKDFPKGIFLGTIHIGLRIVVEQKNGIFVSLFTSEQHYPNIIDFVSSVYIHSKNLLFDTYDISKRMT